MHTYTYTHFRSWIFYYGEKNIKRPQMKPAQNNCVYLAICQNNFAFTNTHTDTPTHRYTDTLKSMQISIIWLCGYD